MCAEMEMRSFVQCLYFICVMETAMAWAQHQSDVSHTFSHAFQFPIILWRNRQFHRRESIQLISSDFNPFLRHERAHSIHHLSNHTHESSVISLNSHNKYNLHRSLKWISGSSAFETIFQQKKKKLGTRIYGFCHHFEYQGCGLYALRFSQPVSRLRRMSC